MRELGGLCCNKNDYEEMCLLRISLLGHAAITYCGVQQLYPQSVLTSIP